MSDRDALNSSTLSSSDCHSASGSPWPSRSRATGRSRRAHPRRPRRPVPVVSRAGRGDQGEQQRRDQPGLLHRAPPRVTTAPPIASGGAGGPDRVLCPPPARPPLRWTSTSSAIGSSSPWTTVAPVASTSIETSGSTSPSVPHERVRPRRADRAVSILHRRYDSARRRSPRASSAPPRSRANRPPAAEEHELGERPGVRGSGTVRARSPSAIAGAMSPPRCTAQEREHRRRERVWTTDRSSANGSDTAPPAARRPGFPGPRDDDVGSGRAPRARHHLASSSRSVRCPRPGRRRAEGETRTRGRRPVRPWPPPPERRVRLRT